MSLQVSDVTSGYYPEVPVVRNVTLSAEHGKVTAVVGPNGCGKSTLLKTIFGFLTPTSGEIHFNGDSLIGKAPHELTQAGLLYIPQTEGFFPDLTIRDNLKMAMWTHRKESDLIDAAIEKAFKAFPILDEKQDKKASTLSGGQAKMLEASRALLYDTKLVIMDEATAGLAPIIAKEIISLVEGFREQGIGVLIVDHNIRMLVQLSDFIYNMGPTGSIVSEGEAEIYQKDIDEIVKQWI
jgi:branched-chain amino acid transport system ATP-binding protein